MRLSQFGAIHSLLYTDRADVYRTEPIFDPITGSTNNAERDTPVIKDLMCRLSYGMPDYATKNPNPVEPVEAAGRLFCAAGVDIKAGDKIVTRRTDGGVAYAVVTMYAGEPQRYPSHTEIELRESGVA